MNGKMKSIRCYEQKSWSAYHSGQIRDPKRSAMEEHLLTCDDCLEKYLGNVEKEINSTSGFMLSEDFTNYVMELIYQEERHNKSASVTHTAVKQEKEFLSNKWSVFISYCAAASIALFFWGGGYFDGLSGSLAKGMQYINTAEISQKIVYPQKKVESSRGFIQTGWTHKVVVEDRPSFIQNVLPKKE